MNVLPNSWVVVKLDEACKIILGQSPPSNTYNTKRNGLPFFQGKAEFTDLHPIPEKWCHAPKKIAEKNDVLLSVRAPVGATNIANQKCCIGRGLAAIRYPPNHKFLYLFFKKIEKELDEKGTGTTFKAISGAVLREVQFPLPPLPEQHRIVDKIEELFSELDNGVANLKKGLAQLKVYRQAVLKAAFEGKLTEQWRREQSDVERRTSNVERRTSAAELLGQIQAERQRQYEQQLAEWKQAVAVWEAGGKQGRKPSKPARPKAYPPLTAAELEGLPGLPEGWMWVRINDVCTCLDSMRVPINKKERQKRSGKIPYYGANGQVGWIDDYLFDEDLILVVEDETFIGREKPFSYKISGKSWVNNHAHVLRSNSQVNVDYLNYSLAYYPFTPLTTGTTGRKKLTQIALMNAPFKLCSEAEQHQIVQAIESRLSVCDHLEQEIERALLQSEALRQSILKKAFEGRLVPQDPGDEPAGELLRRIKLYQAK